MSSTDRHPATPRETVSPDHLAILRAFSDTTADVIFAKDRQGRIIFANPATLALIGKPAEEVIGKTDLEFLADPHVARTIMETDRRIMDTGVAEDVEETVPLPDGRRRIWASRKMPFRDASGNVTGLVGVSRDVTDHRRAETAIRDTLESIRDGFFSVDGQWRFVYVNAAAEEIVGIRREDLIGKSHWDVFPLALGTRVEREYRRAAAGETRDFENYYEPWNRWFHNRCFPRDGGGMSVYFQDITARKRSEQALLESEEKFRTLADNMSQFAWMADETGWLFWYNRRWYEYTGTTFETMQGWGWQAVHHPDHVDRVREKFRHHLLTGVEWEDTFPLRGADGSYRWFLSRAIPIRSPDGRVTRWFGTNTDITELREAQQALASAKTAAEEARLSAEAASKAKDQFLAALSHELRTPLTPALMLVMSMLDTPDLPSPVVDDLSTVRRNIELEIRIIDDLLDLSRVINGKMRLHPETISVHEVLQRSIATCAADIVDRRLELRQRLEADPDYVQADPARLQQVFWNLIKNAVKFTPAGGRIEIATRRLTDAVEVDVRDEGIGIAPENLDRIFGAFEQPETGPQRQFGGLGLGLAISRAIVELHGGRISAHSDGRGQGALFTVRIPAAAVAPQVGPNATPSPRAGGPAQLRILLVEDHVDTARTLSRLLGAFGHVVRVAPTIADGLAELSLQPFDLILSDLGLPDGTGHEMLRQVRRRWQTPAICLSGYGMETDVAASREAGFAFHLTKPVDLDHLLQAIVQATTP